MTPVGSAGDPTPDHDEVLDNAVWHSLRGAHAGFARGRGAALRYDREVSVFHATEDDEAASWDALARNAHRDAVVLFRVGPITPPLGWTVAFAGEGHQMVLDQRRDVLEDDRSPSFVGTTHVRPLESTDVDAMTRLVELTQPGPFGRRTIELGSYVGIFHGDELVAMAGQRLRPPGWCEISAVCTHPEARGRGYASWLTRSIINDIMKRGEQPFLHVATSNVSARATYESLGFVVRTMVKFTVLRS